MQILITHGVRARTRVLRFNRWQALAALLLGGTVAVFAIGACYHWLFGFAAREGWPIARELARLATSAEDAQRERFMRENLDAMAQKVGEMQAKLIKLEAMSERVSAMSGVKPGDLRVDAAKDARGAGQGGPYIPAGQVSFEQLDALIGSLDQNADDSSDLLTLAESRLFEKKLAALMVPSTQPVSGPVGSGFGFRSDPFSGRAALHTGLDFPASVGTPIRAAAGGVVRSAEFHPQYGNLLEIDHRNGLTTRYAHTSAFHVKPGDVVKRGQRVAEVGSTGRSTGPHLHFEVMVDGVQQDPARFLAGRGTAPVLSARARAH